MPYPCSGELIPGSGDANSQFRRNNSVFRFHREFACNALELQRELTSGIAQMAPKSAESLLFSLLRQFQHRHHPLHAAPSGFINPARRVVP
jgi:hypothetical protein